MSRYQVQYKPINPATNLPATNTTTSSWDGNVPSYGGVSPNYDMTLMFVRKSTSGNLSRSDFIRIENETWAVYATVDSIKEAIILAKPLIKEYGTDNVQICKAISADTDLVFGDNQ